MVGNIFQTGENVADTAADVLVDRLIGWGVHEIFGLPGDGINGVMEALRKRQDDIRFIHVRHEESAAFMACAYAKYTGRLGVCLATSGPGGIHLLMGSAMQSSKASPFSPSRDMPTFSTDVTSTQN